MDKKELRKIYRVKRALLTDEEVENRSMLIKEQVFRYIDFSKLSTVHIFLPMEGKKEINTYPIIHAIREFHPTIAILAPRMADDKLVSVQLEENSALVKNEWGIPEPEGKVIEDNSCIDMVLMPLLAYDKNGNRIGYGKGFYDKFLTQCKKNVFKAGLSLFMPEEIIFADEFDIPLDCCITPEHFYKF